MSKTGVPLSLPSFLNQSTLFPAFIIDTKGRILATNKLFMQLCGNNSENTGNLSLRSIFTDDSFAFVAQTDFTDETSIPLTSIDSVINGNEISWELAAYRKNQFICTGNVISRKDNGNLCFSEDQFYAFFNNGPALMWATDKDGRIRMMNKRYKQLTGFTTAEMGKTIWEVYPKEMADQFKKNDDVVLANNELLKIEEVAVSKAGVKRNYLAYKFPLQTVEYGIVVAGCSIDITDIIEKTRQLNFQSHLLDSIEQAVYVLDANRKIVYWNGHAEKMFGWRKKEISQKDISVLTEGVPLADQMHIIINGGKSWDGEIELKKKDGTLIPVHITKSPVFDENNNITGFIGVSKDISEHKIVHKKLVRQNNQFRQIARLQSHAVRRPLANILGLIDLIQHYSDKQDFSEVLFMISLLKESSEDLDDTIRRIVLKAGVYFDPSLKIGL